MELFYIALLGMCAFAIHGSANDTPNNGETSVDEYTGDGSSGQETGSNINAEKDADGTEDSHGSVPRPRPHLAPKPASETVEDGSSHQGVGSNTEPGTERNEESVIPIPRPRPRSLLLRTPASENTESNDQAAGSNAENIVKEDSDSELRPRPWVLPKQTKENTEDGWSDEGAGSNTDTDTEGNDAFGNFIPIPRPLIPPKSTSENTDDGSSNQGTGTNADTGIDEKGAFESFIPVPRPRPMIPPNLVNENTEDGSSNLMPSGPVSDNMESNDQAAGSNIESGVATEGKKGYDIPEAKPKSWLRTKPASENTEDGSSNQGIGSNTNNDAGGEEEESISHIPILRQQVPPNPASESTADGSSGPGTASNTDNGVGVDERGDPDGPIPRPIPRLPPNQVSGNGEKVSGNVGAGSNAEAVSEGKEASDSSRPIPRPWVPAEPVSDNADSKDQEAGTNTAIDDSPKPIPRPKVPPKPVSETMEGGSSGEEKVVNTDSGINADGKEDFENPVLIPKQRPKVPPQPDHDSLNKDGLNDKHETRTKEFKHMKRSEHSSNGIGTDQNEGNDLGASARSIFDKLSPDRTDMSKLLRRIGNLADTAKQRISNDDFTRCFPPKLRRVVSDAIDDLVLSFKDHRLKDLLRKMLPVKNSEGSHGQGQNDTGFNFTSLPESHVRKLVEDIGKLPADLQEKLITADKLHEIDVADIYDMFPINIFPAFTKKKFDEISNMTAEKINALCERLLMRSSTPWNLQAAIDGGTNCLGMIRTVNSKKFLSKSQRLVLMNSIRTYNISTLSNSEFLASLFTRLGSALSPSDIQLLPTELFKESLGNITSTILPFKSQRRALLKKVEKNYGSPDAWSDDVIEKIGALIDDMDISDILHLRIDHIRKAGDTLRLKMKKAEKRFALYKNMDSPKNLWRDGMDTESIKSGFPWLKSDRCYLDNVNLTNLLQALNVTHYLTKDMRPGEISLLAPRITNSPEFLNISDITSDELDSLGQLLDGFNASFFNKLSDEALQSSTVHSRVTFASKAKARAILKKMQKFQDHQLGNLFNAVSLDDIRRLDPVSVFEAVTNMDRMTVDRPQAHQIMSKLRQHFNDNTPKQACFWSQIHGLQDMMRYIPTRLVFEGEIIKPPPPQLSGDPDCRCEACENGLIKTQLYAAFEMAKETLKAQGTNGLDYNAEFFETIGRIVIGMTAEDIENIPEDTEFLTVIEILSEYEDDMELSQVEALTGKLRSYFDMDNRKMLDEVTTITVNQIGRFLQYLDVGRDLPKFPKVVRLDIAKEIGYSKMNKISAEKRNKLLKFALKNMKRDDGRLVDLTRAKQLDEMAIQDLGYLRCGMMEKEINKLTAKAIDENIAEIQTCPFKVAQAKALVKKALKFNTNRLRRRELLVSLGGLLPYISEAEFESVDKEELAAVSEYIVEFLDKREKEIETRENNGFIREWTTRDKQESDEGKKRLLLKLRSALESVSPTSSVNSCHILRSLGSSVTQVAPATGILYNDQQAPCTDELGNLPGWSREAARRRLASTTNVNINTGDLKKVVKTMDPDVILQNAGLIKGLTPDEIRGLNLSNPDVMSAIGEFSDNSPEQLHAVFETWKDQTKRSNISANETKRSNISADDIVTLKNFVCGIPSALMRSIIEPEIVKETVDALGHLTTCTPRQLEVLASKLTREEGFGSNISLWRMWEVAATGHIIGGLPAAQLSELTKQQIQAVAPETITKLPAEKVQEFSVNQLAAFTNNQKNAITSMQRSFMTKDQMAVIDPESREVYGNGGGWGQGNGVFGQGTGCTAAHKEVKRH